VHIDLAATWSGQTVELLLVNDTFEDNVLGLNAFGNGHNNSYESECKTNNKDSDNYNDIFEAP